MAVKLRGTSSLDLPAELMKSFFMPLFENIKNKVDELFEQVKNRSEMVNFIFMVGGFSESPYLKNDIKKHL